MRISSNQINQQASRFQAALLFFVFSFLFAAQAFGQFSFSDNASSYGGTWPNGSNFGTGYNAWAISSGGANAGTFIGNPASNGMGTAGIGTTAFGVFGHSGNTVNAVRFFGAGGTNVPMQIGDVFSFHWAMNFDAGGGFKGFDLRAGGTTVFNVNNGGSATITTTNGNANTVYGTDAMLVTLTRTSWTQYSFTMTSRSGGATFSTTISSALDINNINIYCGNQPDNLGQRNIYFNNFNFTKAAPYETNFSLTDTRILTGSSNLTKQGTGNLTLNAANTFSGNTIINANSLIVNNDNNFGAVPGSATTDKIQIGNGTLAINTTLTVNANRGINLANAASTIDVAASQTGTYNGIAAGSGGLTKTGTGILLLGGANTYSGTTTVSAGTLRFGAAGVIPNTSNVVMSGGTLSTGATTGNAETMGTLQLTASSTLALGTGSHNINFANSSAVSWTANTLLTITGWTGTNNGNSSGTAGRVFIGSGFGGVTGVQLSRIRFNISSVLYGAMQLSTGEIVPSGGQVLYYGGATGTWTGAVWGTAEGGPYTTAWTSGRHAVFNIASANTLTFATTNVAAITYNANITFAAGGTFQTGPSGGAICPVYVDATRTLTMAGQGISAAAGSGLIKLGPGTLQSTNGNTYPGGFTLNSGTMVVGGINAMGNGGALNINGGTLGTIAPRNITSRYTGINFGGDFTIGDATNNSTFTFADNVSLGSITRTVTLGAAATQTFNGIVSGSGSAGLTLAATAAGTLSLGGINTYPGATTINGGSLRPTVSGALPSTTGLSFANTAGAILDLSTNGLAHSVVSLSGGGTTGGNIAFGAATTTTLTANQSTNTTYGGLISGASLTTGGLVKTGTGVLTLSNTGHTYLGTTTITNGELRLNPSSTTATFASQVVLNGGKLSSTSIATSTTWTSSSTLNLNANSTIDLGSNVHSLVFANSSAVTWAGSTLVINGWTGTGGVTGTAGKIFFGNTSGTLNGGQLAKISFTGFPGTPILLGTGELVPAVAGVSYTWNGSAGSSWTDPANWTPGTSVAGPTASDNATIPDVGSYTNALVVSGSLSCFDFTVQANGTYSIGAGASLTVGGAYGYSSSTAPTFNCTSTLNLAGSGTVTIPAHAYGNLNASGGDRILASSGTIGICGTFTRGAGAYTLTGSTVDFNGAGAQTITVGTYNNLTISNNRSTATLTSPAGTIAVAGTFDISTLSNYVASIDAASIFNFTSAGAQTIPAFFYGQLNNTGNGNRTWASSGTIDIAQGFSPGTGTHTITSSTVRYSNTAATTWNLTSFTTNVASRQYNNLIFAGGASTNWSNNGITLGVAGNLNITSGTYIVGSAGGAGILNVDGTFTIDGGTINLSNSATNAGTINLTGNFVQSSGTFNKSGAATGTFNFSRASLSQTISQSGGTITNNGTTWNLGTGATTNTVQLASNFVTGAGTINVRQNATLDFQAFEWSGTSAFTSTGTSPGATLVTAHLSGINGNGASGSVRVSGTKTFSSGTNYTFNATSPQQSGTALNAGSGLSVRNLTINNPTTVTITSSGGTGNSTDAVQVTNQLDLQQGIVILDTRDLQLNSATTIAGAPFSASKMIVTIGASNRFNGRLVRTFNNGPQSNLTFTFPLGDITGTAEYTPFTITDLDYTTASGPFLAVKVKDSKAPFDPSVDNYLTRTFETTTGGTGLTTATGLNLAFNATYITGASDVVGNDALFLVNRFNWSTGTWQEDAGSTCGSGTLSTGAAPITVGTNINNHDIIGRVDAPVYFRSVASGNWENPLTWEASTDPAFGTPAPVTPSIYPIYSNSAGVVVRNTHNVTVTTLAAFGGVPIDQATVDAGGTLTIQTGSMLTVQNGTGTDLTVDGTVVNQSASAWLVAGTISFSNGALYNHNVALGTVPASTWVAGSECRITGAVNSAPSGLGQSFSDFTWNCTGQLSSFSLSGTLTTVGRDLKITNTGGSSNFLSFTATTTLALTVGRDMYVNGGYAAFATGTLPASSSLTITRDLLISSGDFNMSRGNANATSGISASIGRNLDISGTGQFLISFNATGAGALTVTVAGTTTNTSSAIGIWLTGSTKSTTLTCNGLLTQNGASIQLNTVTTGIATLNANAGLTMSSGILIVAGGTGGTGILNIADNQALTLSGGTLTGSTSTGTGTINVGTNTTSVTTTALNLNGGTLEIASAGTGIVNVFGNLSLGSGSLTRTGGSASVNFVAQGTNIGLPHLQTVTQTSATVSGIIAFNVGATGTFTNLALGSNVNFGPNSTTTVTGFTSTNASYLDFGNFTLSGLNFVQSNFGIMVTANADGFWTIATGLTTGSLRTTGTRTLNSSGNFSYNGTTTQVTGDAVTSAYNFSVFNSTTGVTLSANLSIVTGGTLFLNFSGLHGKLFLSTFNLTMVGTAAISGASSVDYIVTNNTGQLLQTVGAGTVTYPVGNTSYNPMTLNNTGGTADVYGVRVLDAVTSPAPFDATKLINRYWVVTEAVGGGSSLAVSGQYNGGEENANFAAGTTLRIGLYTTLWSQNGATSSGSDPFVVSSSTDFTAIGTFGIGKDDGFLTAITTYTWNGSANSSWTTPANWTPATSVAGPTSTDNIIINVPGTNTLNITGSRSITDFDLTGTGTFTMSAASDLTINGNLVYSSSATPTFNCTSTFNLTSGSSQPIPAFDYGNLDASGGDRVLANSGTIGICGTFTRGAGTYTVAGSTVDFKGTGAQTITAGTYNNLTISNARGSANLSSPAGTISVGGVFDVSTLSAYTPVVDAASIFDFTSAGAQTIPAFFYGQLNNSGNGARTWASSGVIDIAQGFSPGTGIQTITGSTIRYSNTSAVTWNLTNFTTNVVGRQYNNLEFVGGASTIWQPSSAFNFGVDGNLTLSGAGRLNANPNISLVTWTVDGDLSITGGGSLHASTSAGNTNLNVGGNTSISNGSLFLVSSTAGAGITATHNNTGTISVSGTGIYSMDAASNTALGIVNLTGDLSVTSTAANAINLGAGTANANNVFNIGGNLTKSGTGTIGIGGTFAPTARFVFNGGTTQTFNYSGAVMTAGNFEVVSGTTLQLNSNLVLGSNASASTLTVNGRLNTGTFTVSPGNAANDFVMGSTGTLSCGSASGVSGNISGFAAGVPDFPAGVTFIFTGTAANTGMNSYTGIASGSNYTLNWEGTTSLTLDKSLSLSNLNFTNNGLILMGASSLTLASGGTISGGPFSTSKMLVTNGAGSLFRSVLNTGVGLPFTWPVGETTGTTEYSPVTVNSIASAGINGTIGFRVVDGVHPDLALATSYLSRYWPCTVTGFNATYTLSNATFTYDSSTDVVVGPEGSLKGNSFNSSTFDWSEYVSSSAGSNVLTITSGLGGATMPTAGPGTYDITGRIDVPVYYRTVAGGSWSTPGTWEISSDPAFLVPVPVTPVNPPTAANSDSVLIRNTHTVNVNSVVSADQVAVKTGGVLNITTGGNYTLPNGPGTADMRVDGQLLVATPLTISSGARLFVTNLIRQTVTGQILPTGVLQIGATGTYEHGTAAGASVIPTATWDVGSTCLLKYLGSTLPTGLGQAFHHFTLDADPGTTGAGGALTTVNGNLTLISTGANDFILGAGTSYTINIGGNLDVQGTSGLDVQSGGGTSILNIGGNLLQAAGTLITRSGSGVFTWNVTGNFTQLGGTFQLNVPSSTGTFNLSGNLTNNGTINAPSGTRNWNFLKTTGIQTFSQSGGTIANAFIWNVGNGTTTNTLQLASNVNLGVSGTSTFFVNSNATIDFQEFVLSGSSGSADAFRMQNNSSLITANSAGIATSGASGSVQVVGTRSYTGASNNNRFTYNRSTGVQSTGTGLPTTMASLTINNTSGSNTVTCTSNNHVVTTLNLSAGLLAIGSGNTMNIATGGTVNATGGDFATGATGGTVNFPGTGTWSGVSNPYVVSASGGVNFGAGPVTIQSGGTFLINGGGFVNSNAPAYSSGSTLQYNTTGTYGRGLEWSATSGKGFPHHVLLTNNTTLNPANTGASNANLPFRCGGNLTISSGSNIYMDFGGNNMIEDLRVLGNLNLVGQLSGSGTAGSDIFIGGNWTNNGVATTNFFPNSREVTFNGSAAQNIQGSNTTVPAFAFLAITNTTGDVTLNFGATSTVTVNNRLQLNSGKLILGSHSLVLAPGCAAMTTGDENNYIVTNGTGVFRQQVPNNGLDRWCPVGPSTTVFGPVTLNQAASGTTDNIDVRVVVAPAFTNAVNDNLQMVNLEWRLTEGVAGGNRLTNTYGWRTTSEATNFLRDEAVYVGNWDAAALPSPRYRFQGTVNPLGGSNPWFAETTPSQPFTGNLNPTRPFVVGNINGLVGCFQTAAATDWNTGSTWVGGVVPPTDALTCISHNITCTATPTGDPGGINFQAGGNVAVSPGVTITLTDNAPIINSSGAVRNFGGGTIAFSGLGLVSGGNAITFNNLQLNGNTTFSTVPTINNELEILPGGFVISANGPIYGPSSTLKYNTGGPYGRSNEWRSTSGAGYPANVLVTGNTALNLDNGTGVNRAIQGNMQIDNGSSVSQGATSFGLIVPGNFTLNGSYTQSTTFGGDLVLGGNWSSAATATLTANNRDVRFNGTSSTQTIANLASGLQFGFLTVDNTTVGGVDLLNTITANTFRVNASRTFNLTSDKIIIAPGGNVQINGTFNAGSGTIEYTNGGNFTNDGTFNRGTSTIDFLSTTPGVVVGSVQTNFHNLRLAPNGSVNFNSGPLRGRVSGTFQMRAGSFCIGNAPIYEAGSKLMYSGGGTFNRNVEWDPTTLQKVEVTNNTTLKCGPNGTGFSHVMADSLIIQSGSTLDMSGPDMTAPTVVGGSVQLRGTLTLSNAAGGDIQVAGNWNNNGGTFNCNGRLTTFDGNLDASLNGPTATTFCLLTVNKSINKTLTANTAINANLAAGTAVRVSGGVFNLNGQTLTATGASNTLRVDAGFTNGQTLRTGGTVIPVFNNYTSDGVTTATLGGKVDYSGAGPETYIAGVTTYNLLWNTGGSTKTIPQTTVVEDSLWIAPSTTVDFAATAFILEARGNVVNNGTTIGSGTGKVELKGLAVQNMSGNGTYRNLDINNTNNVNSTGTPVISRKLNVLLGKILQASASDSITLGATATITEVIGGGEHFVRGKLSTTRNVGVAAETFGNMGVELTAGANLGTVVVTRQSGTALNGEAPCCTGFSSIFRNWIITPTVQPASPDRDLTLTWPSQDDNGMDLINLQLWKRSSISAPWNPIDFVQDVSSSNPRVAVWNGVNSFSQFTGADLNNPLPLGLMRFSARNEKGNGLLNWTMATEEKVTGYVVEKSLDGRNFQAIGTEQARLKGAEEMAYSFTDKQLRQDSYYRIRINFENGRSDLSQVAQVRKLDVSETEIALVPNPSAGGARILLDGMATGSSRMSIQITGMDGKALLSLEGVQSGLNPRFEKEVGLLPSGVYLIRVQTEETVKSLRFVKQ